MNQVIYELHHDLDPEFPLIFGYKAMSNNQNNDIYLHWHDCIELIYCTSGKGWVLSGMRKIPISEGDLIIINSGNIHDVFTDTDCGVFSLDPGNALFENFKLEPKEYIFTEKINDIECISAFERIIAEMTTAKDSYYKQAVHAEIILLVLTLIRRHSQAPKKQLRQDNDQRIQFVKQVIIYLREHFTQTVTLDEICAFTSYSKYYLCRSFKEITGFTIIQYINHLRCQNARNLLVSGKYNVNQSAALSGFQNNSYFSRMYKACFGKLPSEEV